MSDTPESDDPGNVNGTVLDGPLINSEVVGVDYEPPSEGPEVEPPPPAAPPSKSKPAPAPEPTPEPEPPAEPTPT